MFKKSMAALAVLSLSAGLASASEVTLYGIVDNGLLYKHSKVETNGVSTKTDSFALESGISSPSRFGIKGSEDLGNGMKVSFQLENGFKADLRKQIAQAKAEGVSLYAMALGDLTWDEYWYKNSYQPSHYVRQMADLDIPIYNIPGNHDNDP